MRKHKCRENATHTLSYIEEEKKINRKESKNALCIIMKYVLENVYFVLVQDYPIIECHSCVIVCSTFQNTNTLKI